MEGARILHDGETVLLHDRIDDGSDTLQVVQRDGLVGALERRDEVDKRIGGAATDVESW